MYANIGLESIDITSLTKVSYIGDGSSNAGAAKLDQFMEDVREQAHGSDKQINGFDERGLANLVA